MRVTIKQEELLKLVKDYLDNKVEIESINIEVIAENDLSDYITISENSYYIGSFIRKEIKEEK